MMRLAATALAVGLALLPAPSMAQAKYPVSTVTLATHSSPGGGSDVFLRELVKHLQPILGINLAVANITGGSGAKAMAEVAKAPANGSIFYATTPTYIQTTLLSKPEAGYDKLDPMMIVFLDPTIIYTRAESPHKTFADVVADARKNVGKAKWGAANPASLERIAFEKLNRMIGAGAAIVSHEGGGDLMINVLNGTLDIGVGEIQELRGQLEAKKVRLLAVLGEKRLAEFPDLPTAKEQGVDLIVSKFRGLAGPRGVPDDVAKIWEDAIKQALASPAYKAVYAKEALEPVAMGREDARRFTARFAEDVAISLKELGVIR
ncbi:MAG: tripartite tricarboxylate transporter substrate binding protein [Alphaproteobacteria bacterium]|nr:tripartite tricarboxylate transporter substrate binding protein [Alphaproteobacteria bacterium]